MKHLHRSVFAALLLVAGAVLRPQATGAQAPPGPTLAVEDTMYAEVPEVVVHAPRVTLEEIIQRVARGEARRESLLTDQSFTFTLRVLKNAKRGEPELLAENVRRVYRKRPDKVRSVMMRDYRKDEKSGENVRAEFSANMGEEIVNFAFRPTAYHDYRYEIEDRAILGNRVIYTIRFRPRSSLDFENPSGRVWVETNEFVIVREELEFERSPAPLLLKGIDRMVVERQRVDGHWVLRRVLARLELTIPWPKIGRELDFALMFDDYALNSGLDDAIFEGRPLEPEDLR